MKETTRRKEDREHNELVTGRNQLGNLVALRDRLDYAVERGATKSHTYPTTCEASASLPFIPRLTTRRKHRAARIKAIGNGQYPPTAFIMSKWGFELLQNLGSHTITHESEAANGR